MRSTGLMIIRTWANRMRDWLKPCRCHCLAEEAPAGRVLFCAWLLVACGRSSGQQSGESTHQRGMCTASHGRHGTS
jgi:hypothetical protein